MFVMRIKLKKQPDCSSEKLDCMKALKALSDPRRINILNILLTESMSAGAIAAKCRLTAYTASRQLSELHRAGLLYCMKNGQQRLYGISPACEVLINKSTRTLDLKCCQFKLDAIMQDA